MGDGGTIYPTFSCFDDAVDYLNLLMHEGTPFAEVHAHRVVHGIVLSPDGEPSAHAWVENGDEIIQAGIFEGDRVWLKMTRAEFAERYAVQKAVRYSPTELVRMQRVRGPGPWDPEIRKRCNDGNAKPKVWKVGPS